MAKRNTPKAPGSRVKLGVKAGIFRTIAEVIYSTPVGKVREAASNAMDNHATWMVIVLDQTKRSLTLLDNGTGITRERFHEIFESIGYSFFRGKDQTSVQTSVAYFGLGLVSIFQLGEKVTFFTRPRDGRGILRLAIDTKAMFDKRNEDKSVASLSSCFSPMEEVGTAERRRASPPLLNEKLADLSFREQDQSFTQIETQDIKPEHLEAISTDAFVLHLRKVLPLPVEEGEPFLQRFTGPKGKLVRQLLGDKQYTRTIDVFFGIQGQKEGEEEENLEQLWKYFPAFRNDVDFRDDNVLMGESSDKKFAYYIVHSVAVDLHRDREAERETGFWVRNHNFLVKSADFLERPGPGRKVRIIEEPLKSWVFGEVFHRDMNSFLNVSRNEYLFDKEEFHAFHDELGGIVDNLNQELRVIWEKKRMIVEGLVKPFQSLGEAAGTLARTEGRLRDIMRKDQTDEELREEVQKRLENARDRAIEDEGARVDLLLKRNVRPLTLGSDPSAVVMLDPALRARGIDSEASCDARNKKVLISVSPALFDPKEVMFLGKTYTVVFVAKQHANLGVSVNTAGKKIYVNPFNEDLTHYSVSILDVYIALHIAKATSLTKDELVKNALALLGAPCPVIEQYLTPLGDDLRRTKALAGSMA